VYVPLLRQSNLAQALDQLKGEGFWVYGADAEGIPAPAADFSGRVALVLGSEGRGLSRLVAERCDQLVAIPVQGHVDSLNVSVSAGILLFEIRRQQRFADI
jgi:23S rRNA (guanosine2251-2'-O)-methyltransferase